MLYARTGKDNSSSPTTTVGDLSIGVITSQAVVVTRHLILAIKKLQMWGLKSVFGVSEFGKT